MTRSATSQILAFLLLATSAGCTYEGGPHFIPDEQLVESLLVENQHRAPIRATFTNSPQESCATEGWESVFGSTDRTYRPVSKISPIAVSQVHPLLGDVETFLFLSSNTPTMAHEDLGFWVAPLDIQTSIRCESGEVDTSRAVIIVGQMLYPRRNEPAPVFDEASALVEEHGLVSFEDIDISD